MIAIARSFCRDLRAAIRTLGTGRPMALPPLEFVAGRSGLVIRCRGPEIAVLVRAPGRFPETRLRIPAAALDDCQGSDETPVTFQTGPSGRVAVGWSHAGKQLLREYPAPAAVGPAFPTPPARFTPVPGEFLQALDDAGRMTARDSASRFALNRIQLRGSGEIVATDSQHLLLQGGFHFPWTDDTLVPRSDLFALLGSFGAGSVALARATHHVWIQSGAWTVALAIQPGRFPDSRDLIAKARSNATELVLDPRDRAMLLPQLESRSGSKEDRPPVTLDLGKQAVVRVKGDTDARPVEVVLTNSRVVGMPVRAACDRTHLVTALKLGLSRVAVAGSNRPIVCREGARTYLFMPRPDDAIVPPAQAALPTPRVRGPAKRSSPPPTPRRIDSQPKAKRDPATASGPVVRKQPGAIRTLICRLRGLLSFGAS